MYLARLIPFREAAVEKSSLNRAFELDALDAKPGDLSMSRLKLW